MLKVQEITRGYQIEVEYQKKMLRNLQYWLQFCLTIGAIGLVLCYYFYQQSSGLLLLGIILLICGSLGAIIIGYGRHRGKQNLKLLIADYQQKINYLK